MNVSYASAFLVARLAALYSFRCVGPVALFNGVSSLSFDMFRGVLASLWLPHCMGFTCKVVRGSSAFTPCLEHVRAGGG